MDLSAYCINHGIIGEADGRAAPHTAALYLLDKNGRILSSHAKMSADAVGKSIFELYPASAEARQSFLDATTGFDRTNYLLLCRNAPMVLCRAPLLQTGALLAALPTAKGVLRTLRAPAAFFEVMPHLEFSRVARERSAMHEPDAFSAACHWYASLDKAFCTGQLVTTRDQLLHALSVRATYLALLCGCRLEFDFRDAFLLPEFNIDLNTYTGVLLAALMAARRIDPAQTVSLYLSRNYTYGPLLYIKLDRGTSQGRLPELELPARTASMRGAVFQDFSPADAPNEVQICASLSPIKLSRQQLKESLNWKEQFPLRQTPRARYFTAEEIESFLKNDIPQ